MIQELDGFGSQRHEAQFVAFATNAHLSLRQQQIVSIESQDFNGPQTLEEHHADDGQVA
jgi:hypothetical protein